MSRQNGITKKVWITGIVISLLFILMSSAVSAKTINLSDIGIIPWVVIIVGVTLVLLQLIPAAIIFFSTIGIISTVIFKKKKAPEEVAAEEEEMVSIPLYESQLVKSEIEK